MNFSDKIKVWRQVYGGFYKFATPSKTYTSKGFFEYWKKDDAGVPLWMGDESAYEWNRYSEDDIKKYWSSLDWGRIYCSDRYEFTKVLSQLNKSLEGIPVHISYGDSWDWQETEYKSERVRVAKKIYSIMFSLSNKPHKSREPDISNICLAAHSLVEIGDCFRVFEKFNVEDKINSYRWQPYGILIGIYSSYGRNAALKIKNNLSKFFSGDKYFDRVAITLDIKKENTRQTYLIHVIFDDVKNEFEKLKLEEFTIKKKPFSAKNILSPDFEI